MWLEFWNLVRDPFPSVAPAYVGLASHDKAASAIVDASRTRERQIVLTGEPGVGKSTVLRQAIDRIRQPGLRIARSSAPSDEATLLEDLRRSLRFGTPSATDGLRTLASAARLIHAQRGRLVIVVDDAHLSDDVWNRLASIDPAGQVSVVRAQRPGDDVNMDDDATVISLGRLTRQETRHYLTEKLVRAGRTEATFTAGGSTKLHALAMGLPRSLDRLARLTLQHAAKQHESIINEDIIECVALPSMMDRGLFGISQSF